MKPKIIDIVLLTFLAVIFLSVTSCKKTDADKEFDERMAQYNKLVEKRKAREQKLAAMNTAQLAAELEDESNRGVEPFNSMPYTVLVAQGAESASELKNLLTKPDRTSLLGLLALRKMDLKEYQQLQPAFRVKVLLNALQTSKTFNTWGLPHRYWENAALAIIDEGPIAEDSLMTFLDDCRPAPLWGSEKCSPTRNMATACATTPGRSL
jgi:hypothetical protein